MKEIRSRASSPNPLLSSIEEQFGPVKDKLMSLVVVLDSVITAIDDVLDPEFRKNVGGIVSNLNSTAGSVNEIVGSNEADLKKCSRKSYQIFPDACR